MRALWINKDGLVFEEDLPESKYKLSDLGTSSDISNILHNSINSFPIDYRIESQENDIIHSIFLNSDSPELEERIIVCIKSVTPGGRDSLKDEFRIQPYGTSINNSIQLAEELDGMPILMGIYKPSFIDEPIFCAWRTEYSNAEGTSSRQIKNTGIAEATKNGFARIRKRNGEYACAFKKEFLLFYFKNAGWIHGVPSSDIEYIEDITTEAEIEIDLMNNINHKLESGPGKPGINRIYFGAPGTGKSYGIKTFIRKHGISEYDDKISHPNVFRITLHPEFGYNDFIGQVMPVVKKDEDSSIIEYEFTPQIFTKALTKAFEVRSAGEPVFLILEEMSRANVAAVFGDLFQLLDRDVNGISEYKIDNSLIASSVFGEAHSEEKIFLPENIYILGTVNTSDQNVYVMDTAFKRRFEFEYISTDELKAGENDFIFNLLEDGENIQISWLNLVSKLNDFIVKSEEQGGLGLTEDKQLGQFFIKFKKVETGETDTQVIENIQTYNLDQVTGKLLQFLWNDVESASYSTHKLFKEDITSFGKLYKLAKANQNFFSQEFLQLFK